MGLFEKMKDTFSGTNTDLEDWHVLTEMGQVKEVIEASKNRSQLVYKHSHRCSVCYLAKEQIESAFDKIKPKADMNFVNVVHSRSVSDMFTEQTGVRHESPQVLIIQNGEAVWHASHHSIKADAVLEAFDSPELIDT